MFSLFSLCKTLKHSFLIRHCSYLHTLLIFNIIPNTVSPPLHLIHHHHFSERNLWLFQFMVHRSGYGGCWLCDPQIRYPHSAGAFYFLLLNPGWCVFVAGFSPNSQIHISPKEAINPPLSVHLSFEAHRLSDYAHTLSTEWRLDLDYKQRFFYLMS